MAGLKLFGSLLLLLAGCFAAQITSRKLQKSLAVTDAWLELIRLIRGQIDCYLLPLEAILASADPALLTRAGAGSYDRSLPALLSKAHPLLSPEVEQLLRSFIRELGTSYRDEQLKRCDYYLTVLQDKRDLIASALPARLRLCRALSLCVAAGSAILLW